MIRRWFLARLRMESEQPESEKPELEPLDETLELIHDHTRGGPARQVATADSIDSKAVQAFAAASVVLGLGTFAATDLNR
jgi:hypothetical protein